MPETAIRSPYHQTIVDHRPARCPECGSSGHRTVKVEYPSPRAALRYHQCQREECACKFKSVQNLERADWRTSESDPARGDLDGTDDATM